MVFPRNWLEEKDPTCGPNTLPDNHLLRGRWKDDDSGEINNEQASQDEGWKAATEIYAEEKRIAGPPKAGEEWALPEPARVKVLAIMQSHGIYKDESETHDQRAELISKMILDAAIAQGLLGRGCRENYLQIRDENR